jgi:hypothetical protein
MESTPVQHKTTPPGFKPLYILLTLLLVTNLIILIFILTFFGIFMTLTSYGTVNSPAFPVYMPIGSSTCLSGSNCD